MTDLFTDLVGRPESRSLTAGLWARRVTMTALAAVAILALLGVFGQRGHTTTAAGPRATMSLGAPKVVRGGLFFQARIDVRAQRDIEHPRFVFGRGWMEGMQVNSVEPGPVSEAPRDGHVVMSYAKLAAGDHMTVWVQFQVDPTQFGRRDFSLELDDADAPVARVSRKLTVLP